MAFIMFLFIHFILKFRDSCKDYYSQLVVHSQFRVTLSSVLVQDFLSQSICLLTNNSNCKFTFLLFLCLTYTLAQTHEKKHKIHQNHALNSQFHIHHIKHKQKSPRKRAAASNCMDTPYVAAMGTGFHTRVAK